MVEFSTAGAGSGALSGLQLAGASPLAPFAAVAGGLAGGFLGAGGRERQSFPLGIEHLLAQQQRAGQAGGELHTLAQQLIGRGLSGQLPGNVDAMMEQLRMGAREQVMRDFPRENRAVAEQLAPTGFLGRGGRAAVMAQKVAQQQGFRLNDIDLNFVNQRVQQILANFQFGVGTGAGILTNLAGQLGQATQQAQPQTTFAPSRGQEFLSALAPLAGMAGQFAGQQMQAKEAAEIRRQDQNFLISQQERQMNDIRRLLNQPLVQGTGG